MGENSRVIADIRLDVVICDAANVDTGVVVAKDDSGAELLELGRVEERYSPGDRLRIESPDCLLRRRQMGVEISRAPIVDNDGVHPLRMGRGEVFLKAGRYPLRVDWFNALHGKGLEVTCQAPGQSIKPIPDALLWRGGNATSATNLSHGLNAECYEGNWEIVPDFDLLQPTRIGVTNNFNLRFGTCDDLVGLRFTGYFEAPVDGSYTFGVASDDGALLFLKNVRVPVTKIGKAEIPVPQRCFIDEPMNGMDERHWAALEGRVNFISRVGKGVAFELKSDAGSIWVTMADADEIDPNALLNSYVRVVGLGRSVLTSDGRLVLGRLAMACAREITILENAPNAARSASSLTAVGQVQSLRIDEAKQELPVRIRGVITSVSVPYWMSVQDGTRGIFVKLGTVTNFVAVSGKSCEIIGKTGAGDFAPVVVADRVIPLGDGRLPIPARPTWNELINGSMDVQWVEFQGLVTAVRTNQLTLLLPEGHLDVQLDGYHESELNPFEKTVVRIRGVFFAVWKTDTRTVQVGTVEMRNASINVDTPAPADPFDVPVKRPRDLFLFDPQATAFQRIKVRGQVVLAEPKRIFMMEADSGMSILPVEAAQLGPGDVIEAVGYPDISGAAPRLREAIVRKISEAPLPKPRPLAESDFKREGIDSTLVTIEGKLMGMHFERDSRVLEMSAYGNLFLARFRPQTNSNSLLQPGSRLALTGVYLRQGGGLQDGEHGTFELLLNSPASVAVISEPPWWTPQRLLTIVGILLVGLALAAIWISLLRRQVELRTRQLHREIREREIAERQRALETERSRIARDLHDDLGSSLTEIGVLASTGQRPHHGMDLQGLFNAIAAKARGLIAALDVIVWAVDPEDNSLQSVADYLSGFAGEYLANSTISCRFKIPVSFPPLMLDGRVRHDLLLTVKETLNNIVRHGIASEVEFKMAVIGEALEIEIADNGKGFDPATARAGSGLKNLSTRLMNHGGGCQVESIIGKGTTVTIHLPLSGAAKSPVMS